MFVGNRCTMNPTSSTISYYTKQSTLTIQDGVHVHISAGIRQSSDAKVQLATDNPQMPKYKGTVMLASKLPEQSQFLHLGELMV